jgi:plastocyanin
MRALSLSAILAAAALVACGGDKSGTSGTTPTATPTPSASATAPSETLTPDPGGKMIVVELYSDDKGNYFKPAEIKAKKGDVVRYTLKVGVHNVHFLPDSNAGKSGFPTLPSDMLQLPGQTFDVKVAMAPGSYYFQCDPHAALGMKGHVIVE